MRGTAWLAGVVLLATATLSPAIELDRQASRVGFELRTRWGQVLHGHFQTLDGEVEILPDGLRRLRVRLQTHGVEITGHPRYTRFARGEGFFDVERWPTASFVSEPYTDALLAHGGQVAGALTIRGITRRETFTIAPGGCQRPGLDCDVFAGGLIDREEYGMGRWTIAISDDVRFFLRLRLRDDAT